MRDLERVIATSDARAYAALVTSGANTSEEFHDEWLEPGVTRAVIQERLRAEVPQVSKGLAYDVYIDVLTEYGRNARVGTFLVRVFRTSAEATDWRIARLNVLTTVRGLYRLSREPRKGIQDCEPRAERRGLRAAHSERRRLCGRNRRGRNRHRHSWPWGNDVCADAGRRKGPGPHLHWQRRAHEPFQLGVPARAPRRIRSPARRHHLPRSRRGPARSPSRRSRVPGEPAPIIRHRARGSQPRPMVGDSEVR